MHIDVSNGVSGSGNQWRLDQLLAAAVVLILLIGALVVMSPFLSALAWAMVMAFALWPLQRRLTALLRGRRTIAAFLMTSSIAIVLLLPTIVIVVNLSDDARELARESRAWAAKGLPTAPQWVRRIPVVGPRAGVYWDELASEVTNLVRLAGSAAEDNGLAATDPATPASPQPGEGKVTRLVANVIAWVRRWFPAVGLAIIEGAIQLLLSVFLTFFIFRDGEALAHRLGIAINRIAGARGLQLLQVGGATVRGVVYGILGTALVQGVLASLGFAVAGVPGAALLGLITFFLSPLPVGPPLIWIPAAAWLFHQDQSGWGIFMVIWGLVISSVDNVVKPWIISHGSATPFVLILIGVIGGAMAFGLIGIFLGPTLLAVAYRMVEQWAREPAGT